MYIYATESATVINEEFPHLKVLKFLDSMDQNIELTKDIYVKATMKKLDLEFDFEGPDANVVGESKVLKLDSRANKPRGYVNMKDFLSVQKNPSIRSALQWYGFENTIRNDVKHDYYIKNDFADAINKVYKNDIGYARIEKELDSINLKTQQYNENIWDIKADIGAEALSIEENLDIEDFRNRAERRFRREPLMEEEKVGFVREEPIPEGFGWASAMMQQEQNEQPPRYQIQLKNPKSKPVEVKEFMIPNKEYNDFNLRKILSLGDELAAEKAQLRAVR